MGIGSHTLCRESAPTALGDRSAVEGPPASNNQRYEGLRLLPVTALGVDLVATSTTVAAAALLRWHLPSGTWDVDLPAFAPVTGIVIVLVWVLFLALRGAYDKRVLGEGTDELRRAALASLSTGAATAIALYLLKFDLSRVFFVITFTLGTALVVAGRLALRRWVRRQYVSGRWGHRVLIAGSPTRVAELVSVLRRHPGQGMQVIGALTPGADGDPDSIGTEVLGSTDDLTRTAATLGAETVIIAEGTHLRSEDFRRAAWELGDAGIKLIVAPGINEVAADRMTVRPVGGLPLMHIDPPRREDSSNRVKRLTDVVGAAVLLLIALPTALICAIAVKLHDGGPVLFRQTRVGIDGQHFSCLKFRTMVIDAEARLEQLVMHNEHDGVLFKIAHDPRITRPGRIMRKFSLDEIPQFWNVLRGDMSLVGPRPPLPSEVAEYEDDVHRRLRVRPGITGLWQVSGRSDLTWEESVRMDLYYVDNWSPVNDVLIMLRTVKVVLSGNGAY